MRDNVYQLKKDPLVSFNTSTFSVDTFWSCFYCILYKAHWLHNFYHEYIHQLNPKNIKELGHILYQGVFPFRMMVLCYLDIRHTYLGVDIWNRCCGSWQWQLKWSSFRWREIERLRCIVLLFILENLCQFSSSFYRFNQNQNANILFSFLHKSNQYLKRINVC